MIERKIESEGDEEDIYIMLYYLCISNTLTIPPLSLLDISQPPKETLQLLTQHHPTNQ